jgi:hypothetical protein
MTEFEDLQERLRKVEEQLKGNNPNNRLDLDALPLRALRDWYTENAYADATQFLLPHSVGVNELGNLPSARVHATAHANIAIGVPTAITFDTVDFDLADMVDLAVHPTRITFTVGGLYLVGGAFSWDANVAGVARHTMIVKGGYALGNVIARDTTDPTGGDQAQNVGTLYYFVPGNYIELVALADATTAPDLSTPNAAPAMWATFHSNYEDERQS